MVRLDEINGGIHRDMSLQVIDQMYYCAYLSAQGLSGKNYHSLSAAEKATVRALEKLQFLLPRHHAGIVGLVQQPKLFEDRTILLPR